MKLRNSEYTFMLLKPDAFSKKVALIIRESFPMFGLHVEQGLFIGCADERIVKEHYAEHKDKPFYKDLVEFMRSGPIECLIVRRVDEKMDAIAAGRAFCLYFRNKYSTPDVARENVIHAADSIDAAEREIKLWF